MTTVREFKDLGVEFVMNDKVSNLGFDSDRVMSFAWRTYAGAKPNFNGDIEFTFNGEGCEMQDARSANNINWSIVKKWRPLLDKSAVKPVNGAAVKPSDDKPVFTQAMADAGEVAAIGSVVHTEFVSGIVITDCDKNECLVVKGNGCYCVIHYEDIKPIDTRTPKQKAVDSMKELLDGKWCSEYAEILYDAGYRRC